MSVQTETLILTMEKALDGACTEEFARIANMKLNQVFIPIREQMIRNFTDSIIGGLERFRENFIRNACLHSDVKCLPRFSHNIDAYKVPSKDFCPYEILKARRVHPEYLCDMVNHFGNKVSNYMSMNEPMDEESDNLITSHQLGDIVSRQCVRECDNTLPEFFNREIYDGKVIPFTTDFEKNKLELLGHCDEIKAQIHEAIEQFCHTVQAINKRYEGCPVDDKIMKINRLVYDLMFNVLHVIKCMCKHYMHNLECFAKSTNCIDKMCDWFGSNATTNVNESVYDMTLVPTNTEDLSSRMIDGDISAYKEFADNVYNYHSGIFHNKYEIGEADGINNNFDTYIEKFKYNREVYIDILNLYQNIFDSLNVLSKNSDDYLMVFDDMMKKSGLLMNLKDRFYNDLELIDRVTQYSEPIAGAQNVDMYYRILNDIHNYPTNMEAIAGMIRDVYTQACDLRNRFESKINGEFTKSQAIVELQNYMAEFDDQYKYIVNITAAKLMARLKELAYLAERHSLVINQNEKPVGFIEDVDFTEGVVLNDLEIHRLYNESDVRSLSMEYYKMNAYNLYGKNVVFSEADGGENKPDTSTNAQNQPTTGQKEGKDSTKVNVTDNSKEENVTSGKKTDPSVLKAISEAIQKWFDDVLNKFDTLCERQAGKNTKWLDRNKEALMNRRYVNVSADILPYEDGMDSNKILNELSTAAGNISAVKGKINTLNTEADVIRTLFPNVKCDDPANFGDDCVRYFKVGSGELTVKNYANSELGNLVKNSVIPFCESYYTTYVKNIKDNIGKIKTAITGATEDVVTESNVDVENGFLIYEAEGDTNAASDGEKKEASGVKQKMDWVRKYTKLYTGSALNAVRDRNNDYFKLLSALVPKTKPNLSENDDEK